MRGLQAMVSSREATGHREIIWFISYIILRHTLIQMKSLRIQSTSIPLHSGNTTINFMLLRLSSRLLRPAKSLRLFTTVPRPRLSFAFSTSTNSSFANQLEEELKYEKENAPSNEYLLQTIQNSGWKVNTSSNTLVELTKKDTDKSVSVVFYAEPPHSQEEAGEGEEAKAEGFGSYVEFTVYVEKTGNPKVLYGDFLCNQEDVSEK